MRSLGVLVAAMVSPQARAAAVASALLSACSGAPSTAPRDAALPLRLGLFAPDATATAPELATRYRPVVTYFEAQLSRRVDLRISRDAGRLLADFEAGGLDAISNRSIAFPHAHQHVGALPLVSRVEDRNVTTVFLARADDARESLHDFRGARLDFSLRLGSSYLMGQQYLEQQGIEPKAFFGDVHFSSVADEAINHVVAGQADLGVANSLALTRQIASGTLPRDALKIVAETPPHAGQLWFVAEHLPPAARQRLRDAFLALSPLEPDQRQVLELLGASGFVPAMGSDYIELDTLMRRYGVFDFDVTQLP